MLKINNWMQKAKSEALQTNLLLMLCLFFLSLLACSSQDTSVPTQRNAAPATQQKRDSIPAQYLVSRDYLLGKFDPSKDPNFVVLGKPYTDKPNMMLRKEAYEAFKKMWESAQKDGITLKIISSTRTFAQQKTIWEEKWGRFAKGAPASRDRALKILEYSSMPGSSRHHWGTDVDLNDLNNPSFEGNGKYAKVYEWLVAHAGEFGFCQPYTAGRPFGYHEEKWHWSYVPLSKPFLAQYKASIHDSDIQGFLGANMALEIGAVEHYVLGINSNCTE